jgi:hypothetical protein
VGVIVIFTLSVVKERKRGEEERERGEREGERGRGRKRRYSVSIYERI